MDSLPNEIYLNILSYLDDQNYGKIFLDTVALLTAYPRKFLIRETAQLFKLRFPPYFKENLYTNENLGKIYLDMLNLQSIFTSLCSNKHSWYQNETTLGMDTSWYYVDRIWNNINLFKDGIKYLITNDFIGLYQIEAACIQDEEVCDYFKSRAKLQGFIVYVSFCIDKENQIVFDHIVTKKLYDDNELIKLLSQKRGHTKLNLDLFFKHVKITPEDKLRLLCYIGDLNLYRQFLGTKLISVESTLKIFISCVEATRVSFDIIQYTINTLLKFISKEYIINFYETVYRSRHYSPAVMVTLSQLELIKKHYLI